jgi:hypothetical protein
MKRRRAVIGLTMLCAIAMSALLASGASAATSGTTAFTCKSGFGAAGKFTDAHCLNAGAGDFKHVGIKAAEVTEITGTSAKTASSTTLDQPSVLEGTLSGIITAIECKKVNGTGTMENVLEGEVHFAKGGGVLNYTECAVTKPAGRECKVKGNAVTTNTLTATTKGAGDLLEFIGEGAGKSFAPIVIENCKENKPPNLTYPVTGTVKIPPSGATLSSTIAETKAQGTLIFGGGPSGLSGSLTLSGRKAGAGGAFTPLTVTTPPFTE